MHHNNARTLAAIIAAVITLLSVCPSLPCLALIETDVGYNAEDVALLRGFLETEDAEGVKIGERLNPGVYDPDDPGTWSIVTYGSRDGLQAVYHGVVWAEVNGELRAAELHLYMSQICGSITLPGCVYLQKVDCSVNNLTSVDISACPALTELNAGYNELTGLDLSCCPELRRLSCDRNMIESLSLSGCPKLAELHCGVNKLKRLDVSCCPELTVLSCYYNDLRKLDLSGRTELVKLEAIGNLLTQIDLSGCAKLSLLDLYAYRNRLGTLDLSQNPELFFDHITAEGNGCIGHTFMEAPDEPRVDVAMAIANPGDEFIGWYTEDGESLGNSWLILEGETEHTAVIARFTGASVVYGDGNGDGTVNAADALIILRAALGLDGEPDALLRACDMDVNGVVNAADALIVLRIALGIE